MNKLSVISDLQKRIELEFKIREPHYELAKVWCEAEFEIELGRAAQGLDAILGFCSSEHPEHAFAVTCGLTNNITASKSVPFELSYRLSNSSNTHLSALRLAAEFLATMARQIESTGDHLEDKFHFLVGTPLVRVESELHGFLTLNDRAIPQLSIGSQTVAIRQLFGIAASEHRAMDEGCTLVEDFVKIAEQQNRLLVTDVDRKSFFG